MKSFNYDYITCNCTYINSMGSVKYHRVTIDHYLKWYIHTGITIKKLDVYFTI